MSTKGSNIFADCLAKNQANKPVPIICAAMDQKTILMARFVYFFKHKVEKLLIFTDHGENNGKLLLRLICLVRITHICVVIVIGYL